MATMEVKEKGKNYRIYTNGCIRIDNVRGSYVHADKPFKKKGDPDDKVSKYSMVGLLPKATHEEAREAIEKFIKGLLKDNKDAKVGKKDWFIRDGDDSAKDEQQDCWTVNASEARKPKCRDRSGEIVDETEEIAEMFRSGYWFNMLIRPWFQDNEHGKKVNAGLVGIQFVKKDKTFGQGDIDESDAWDEVEGDDDDEDDGL